MMASQTQQTVEKLLLLLEPAALMLSHCLDKSKEEANTQIAFELMGP